MKIYSTTSELCVRGQASHTIITSYRTSICKWVRDLVREVSLRALETRCEFAAASCPPSVLRPFRGAGPGARFATGGIAFIRAERRNELIANW
jgi:hypothetical protein